MMEEYARKARLAYPVVIVSFIFELCLLIAMTLVWPPEGKTANLTVCLLLVAPLLPFFPFLLKRNLHAYAWLCFVLLLYIMLAIPTAFDPRYGMLGRLELANLTVLFTFAMMFVRWEQRRLGITITR